MAAVLRAGRELEGGLVVFELTRTAPREVACARIDRDGAASLPWYAHEGKPYLVGIVRADASKNGSFRQLRSESGGRIKQTYGARGRQVLREHLDVGRY